MEAGFPPSGSMIPGNTSPELSQRRVKYAKYPPRILFLGPDSKIDDLWPRPVTKPAPPPSDGLVNATRLSRRLQALKLALEDLPRQARRMARWRVRREAITTPTLDRRSAPARRPAAARGHSRGRQSPRRLPLARLGGAQAGHELSEIIRRRINQILCHSGARRNTDLQVDQAPMPPVQI